MFEITKDLCERFRTGVVTAEVVLPTPPFWLVIAMICAFKFFSFLDLTQF